MLVGFKNSDYKKLNSKAKEAIRAFNEYKEKERQLAEECLPVLLALINEGMRESEVQDVFYNSLQFSVMNCNDESENFASYLRNRMRYDVLSENRNTERRRLKKKEMLTKSGYLEYFHSKMSITEEQELKLDEIGQLDIFKPQYEKSK